MPYLLQDFIEDTKNSAIRDRGLNLILTCLLFLLLGALIYQEHARHAAVEIARNWSAVPSEVVESRVEPEYPNGFYMSEKPRWRPLVVFEYLSQGVTYRVTQEDRFDDTFAAVDNREEASAITQRFPVGEVVMAHVNPATPAIATISVQPRRSGYGFYVVLIYIVAFGVFQLGTVIYGYVKGPKHVDPKDYPVTNYRSPQSYVDDADSWWYFR